MSEYWYKIVQQLFSLPSDNTVIAYRDALHINEGFLNLIFNPIENFFEDSTLLVKYIEMMWSTSISELHDDRFVLAINAATLKVIPTFTIKIFYGVDFYMKYQDFLKGMDGISDYVFKNSLNTKMDDRLAFHFFDWSHIQNIIKGNLLFIPILLLSSLLLQVFFNKKLTRMEKYHLINIGTVIVFLQRILYFDKKKPLIKGSNKKRSYNSFISTIKSHRFEYF